MARYFAFALATVAAITSSLFAQEKRAIGARDCVNVRDVTHDDALWRSTLMISPDGKQVAYPLTSPNLKTNENDIELYVRRLPTNSTDFAKPILIGDISAERWRPDSRNLTVLMKENGRKVIEQVDAATGGHHILFAADEDITEYTFDRSGNILVYGIEERQAAQSGGPSPQEIARGYRIPFQTSPIAARRSEELFLTRKTLSGWSQPDRITITSPLTNQPAALAYGYLGDLTATLSPDGQKLLVRYFDYSGTMPEEWRDSGYMQYRNRAGVLQAFRLLVVYDLATGSTSVPLKTPFAISAPIWSAGSNSFVVAAFPPVGSELEQENVKTGLIGHSGGAHLLWVDVKTGNIEDVAPKLAYPFEGPLFLEDSGNILVRANSLDTIDRYSRVNGKWQEASSWKLPIPRIGTQVTTDGKYVIGNFNDTTTPPELFLYRPGEKQIEVFAKLNPQFDHLTLAQPREVHWRTSSGFDATGILLLPPNHIKSKKYPLVIHTKPFGNFFVCSFGNSPSFAPQPIANADILYLGPGQLTAKPATQREEDYFPKGYPGYQGTGGVAEAAFALDFWDSAVQSLDQEGLIDTTRLGIIGFSRTGWYTEFILTHSKIKYRAATVADNVQYSLGEYWLIHDSNIIKSYDQTYGGPPYGPTLRNWLDYSISFNLEKIHTPLLMEQMGSGTAYDNAFAPPIFLATSFEVFVGLNRLNKPVELYYYPNENHSPQHPQALLGTMQRNVDWYRFWLKDEEDPDPAKAEQYKRWRELRKLQEQDQKKVASSPK